MRVGEEGGSAHRIWLEVLSSGLLGVRAGAGTPKALGAAAWAHPQGGKKKKTNNTKTTPWVLCQAYFSSCLLPSPSPGVKCLLSLLRA